VKSCHLNSVDKVMRMNANRRGNLNAIVRTLSRVCEVEVLIVIAIPSLEFLFYQNQQSNTGA
jgi:hypothetical protein